MTQSTNDAAKTAGPSVEDDANAASTATEEQHGKKRPAEQQMTKDGVNDDKTDGPDTDTTTKPVADTATTKNSDSPAPVKKKRSAERQITKDDQEDDDEDGSVEPTGTFQRADEETLKKRRIVKIKRPSQDESKSKNPFAAALATTKSKGVFGSTDTSKGVFGSGVTPTFGGFGSTATSTSITTTTDGGSSSIFGFGINKGSTENTTGGFGNNNSASTGFGASSSGSAFAAFAKKEEKKKEAAVVLPTSVDLSTGEEEEDCVFQVRAKSYVLRESKLDEEKEEPDKTNVAAAPSVPPSSSEAPKAIHSDDKKDGAKEGDDSSEKKEEEAKDETKLKWREVGVGPLRVLQKSNKYRVVQRRESTPGGAGTKLLVNVALCKLSKVSKLGDKHVQLTTLEGPNDTKTFLFRCKMTTEAQGLEQALTKATAASSDEKEE